MPAKKNSDLVTVQFKEVSKGSELSESEVHILLDAIVGCHLVNQQNALLSGIPSTVVASIPRAGQTDTPKSQLLMIINALNDPNLEDQSCLQLFLRNAYSLSREYRQQAVFRQYLDRYDPVNVDNSVLGRVRNSKLPILSISLPPIIAVLVALFLWIRQPPSSCVVVIDKVLGAKANAPKVQLLLKSGAAEFRFPSEFVAVEKLAGATIPLPQCDKGIQLIVDRADLTPDNEPRRHIKPSFDPWRGFLDISDAFDPDEKIELNSTDCASPDHDNHPHLSQYLLYTANHK